jgi:hypothetical protein
LGSMNSGSDLIPVSSATEISTKRRGILFLPVLVSDYGEAG